MTASSLSRICGKIISLILCSFLIVFVAGCDSHDSYNDHVPAPGKAGLVVDNHTGDDISIFVDGVRIGGVEGDDYTVIDLEPGFARLVLAADHDDRSFRDDVDLLDGRLTILDVQGSSVSDYNSYHVETTFE